MCRRRFVALPQPWSECHYHSLLCELSKPGAGDIQRFREFVICHGDYIYPEYIVAYQRKRTGGTKSIPEDVPPGGGPGDMGQVCDPASSTNNVPFSGRLLGTLSGRLGRASPGTLNGRLSRASPSPTEHQSINLSPQREEERK